MKDKREALVKFISHLNECAVIVEGKRDVEALSKIGVRAKVMTIDRFKRTGRIDGPVVILTDFDRSGESKAAEVEGMAIERGLEVDREARERFRRFFGVLTLEEVPEIFRRIYQRGD